MIIYQGKLSEGGRLRIVRFASFLLSTKLKRIVDKASESASLTLSFCSYIALLNVVVLPGFVITSARLDHQR